MIENRLSRGRTAGDRLALAFAYFDDNVVARFGMRIGRCQAPSACIPVGREALERILDVYDNCISYLGQTRPCVRVGRLLYDGYILYDVAEGAIVNLRHIFTVRLVVPDKTYRTLALSVGAPEYFSDLLLWPTYGVLYKPSEERITYYIISTAGGAEIAANLDALHEEIKELVKAEMKRYLASRRIPLV